MLNFSKNFCLLFTCAIETTLRETERERARGISIRPLSIVKSVEEAAHQQKSNMTIITITMMAKSCAIIFE